MLLVNRNELFISNMAIKHLCNNISSYIEAGDQRVYIPMRDMSPERLAEMHHLAITADPLKHIVHVRANDTRMIQGIVYLPTTDEVSIIEYRNFGRTHVTNEDTGPGDWICTTVKLNNLYIPLSISPDYNHMTWGSLHELEPITLDHYMRWSRAGGMKWTVSSSHNRLDFGKLKRFLKGDMRITLADCWSIYIHTPELFFDIAPDRKPEHYLSIGTQGNSKTVNQQELIDVFGIVPKLKANVYKSFTLHSQL